MWWSAVVAISSMPRYLFPVIRAGDVTIKLRCSSQILRETKIETGKLCQRMFVRQVFQAENDACYWHRCLVSSFMEPSSWMFVMWGVVTCCTTSLRHSLQKAIRWDETSLCYDGIYALQSGSKVETVFTGSCDDFVAFTSNSLYSWKTWKFLKISVRISSLWMQLVILSKS